MKSSSPRSPLVSLVLTLSVSLAACGVRGTSTQNIEQAQREVQLATALYMEEGRVAEAIEHLREAIELDPESYDAFTVLGTIHLGQGDVSAAEGDFRRAIDLMVEQHAAGHDIATARNYLGATLMAQSRFEEALEPITLAANDELFQTPHVAWGNLGLCYLELRRYPEAIAALVRSIELGPRFCTGYYWLGRAYFETEQLEDAEIALVRSVEVDPSCSTSPRLQNAWRLRGEVRAQLGYRDDALADFERCVELGPNSPDGRACQRQLDATP
ncbi:MAG: tetratricopeptide repeat protein [Polyangiales bacterium]|nr:tetratricopeptide repeat protein [Myxococcales bacterium]MCB9661616.1 tetratricopeptide repeat protein [Sandaracinaceae bacterium]